jgi:hypothetical protein
MPKKPKGFLLQAFFVFFDVAGLTRGLAAVSHVPDYGLYDELISQ